MIDCLIDWLKVSEIRNFLKVKWEGIKGLSQTFTFFLLIPENSNSFHHETLERRWHDFFHLFKWQGVLKIFEFHLKYISNSETLCNSIIFTRGDKMTSSNYMKYELGVSKDQIQSLLELFFQFGVIWILFKSFFSKNKIHGK